MKQPYRQLSSRIPAGLRLLIRNCYDHHIGRGAAGLAYYLMFAIFPLLIFISNLLGMLELNIASITAALRPVLPGDVVNVLESYLHYVSDNSSRSLFWFSLVFTLWFPLRAVMGLMDDVRLAYGLGPPRKLLRYTVRQVLFTLVFLLMILLTLVFSIFGRRLLETISGFFGLEDLLERSVHLLTLWEYLRFGLIAAIMFACLGLLYALALDKRPRFSSILPGVVFSLLAWLLLSIGFSQYVENFGNYSLVYGTLGAVVVLLLWLYMSAYLLILGSEINAALLQAKEERRQGRKTP